MNKLLDILFHKTLHNFRYVISNNVIIFYAFIFYISRKMFVDQKKFCVLLAKTMICKSKFNETRKTIMDTFTKMT